MAEKAGIRRIKLQRGRHLVKRGETWYLESCSAGLQTRRSLDTGDVQEATRRAAEVDVIRPVLRPAPRPKAPQALTLGKALEEYGDWYERNNRTAWRAIPSVRWFVESVGPEADTRIVTREHVQHFVTGRVDGRAAITVRDDFARVRAFLRWIAARREGAIVGTPWTGIERPKVKAVTREAPSPEKVRAVLAKLRSHPWLGDLVFTHIFRLGHVDTSCRTPTRRGGSWKTQHARLRSGRIGSSDLLNSATFVVPSDWWESLLHWPRGREELCQGPSLRGRN